MAVTKTSLINKALTLCGAAPITNITDDTQNARVANRVYEQGLRSILCETKWNFATTRATLSVSAVEMPWEHDGEAYVYVRPSNILRIFEVSDPMATWREEGDYIISDTADLGIKAVYYHDDPSKYPGFFLDAFIDKLCSEVSFAILNSGTKAEAFLTKYKKISLPDAMAANSQIGTQQVMNDSDILGTKLHNGGGDPSRSYG